MLNELIKALPRDAQPDKVLVMFSGFLSYTLVPRHDVEIANPEFKPAEALLKGDMKILFRDDSFEPSTDRPLFEAQYPVLDSLVYHRTADGQVLLDELTPLFALA